MLGSSHRVPCPALHAARWEFSVRAGDVLHMYADCQERLQHSIILEKSVVAGPRMSLVFKERLPGV